MRWHRSETAGLIVTAVALAFLAAIVIGNVGIRVDAADELRAAKLAKAERQQRVRGGATNNGQ